MQSNESRLETLLAAAVDIADESEREAYLQLVCAGESAQLVDLQSMVHDYFAAGSLIDQPAVVRLTDECPAYPQSGTRIGPYKLLEQIGEGGMGIVYMAEQNEPIRRKVALKVIKPGMDTRQVVARFEAERQALALMDHSNIARVIDGGTTDSGRPYFVMELVRGIPLTEYCDKKILNTRQRLELFVTVCRAVQHAHQRAIIHRDLKPTNILVTHIDAAPVVKIIDFGIAKTLGDPLTDKTLFTHFSQMIGTPSYMSPEQAEMTGQDIDTRTDVYSLGVVLYQLLTGGTPFDKVTLQQASHDELRRIIREVEPPKPSVRVSTLKAEQLSTVSGQLGFDLRKYSYSLQGELDWIVMRAMEKDRNRRYELAGAFADDVERYLRDEPVLACPPSMVYLLSKFVRRRKRVIATAALVSTALLVGSAVSIWQAVIAHQERNRGDQTAKQVIEETRRTEEIAVLAEQHRHRAEAAEREQRRLSDRSENLLYASAIRLASRLIQSGDDEQAQQLLNDWLPKLGGTDRRGIEWRLLQQQQFQVPGEVLLHLPDDVSCVRISPDGAYLVAATDGGTIQRYSFLARRPLAAWETGLTDVRRMEFDPSGKHLAVMSYEAEAVVVETSTGQVRLRCPQPVKSTANPDVCFVDGRLLTIGQGGIAILWNLEQGAQERVWDTGCATLLDVTTSPGLSGVVLLTDHVNALGEVQLVTALTKDDVRRRAILTLRPSVIAVSPNGQTLAVGGQTGEVELLDLSTFQRVALWTLAEQINELSFSPDGEKLAAAERTGVVHIWRWRVATKPTEGSAPPSHIHWRAHARPARSAVFTPDSRQLITAGIDGRIVRWTWDQPRTRRMQPPSDVCYDLLVLHGARAMATVDTQALSLFDLNTGDLLTKMNIPVSLKYTRRLAGDDTGHWLALAAESGKIVCGNLQLGYSLGALPDSSSANSFHMLAFLPGTRTLVAVETRPALRVRGWDVEQRRLIFDRRYDAIVPVQTALARRDEGLIAMTEDSLLRINLRSGEIRDRWPCDGRDVSCVVANPDGALLAIGRKNRTLTLMDLATGEVRQTLHGHLGRLERLEFSADGRTLLAFDVRGDLRFWHVDSGSELLTLPSAATIKAFDLSADGRWLAIARSGEIEVLDMEAVSILP